MDRNEILANFQVSKLGLMISNYLSEGSDTLWANKALMFPIIDYIFIRARCFFYSKSTLAEFTDTVTPDASCCLFFIFWIKEANIYLLVIFRSLIPLPKEPHLACKR